MLMNTSHMSRSHCIAISCFRRKQKQASKECPACKSMPSCAMTAAKQRVRMLPMKYMVAIHKCRSCLALPCSVSPSSASCSSSSSATVGKLDGAGRGGRPGRALADLRAGGAAAASSAQQLAVLGSSVGEKEFVLGRRSWASADTVL